MAELKTKATEQSVEDFLNSVEPQQKREDAFTILQILKDLTREQPVLWGNGIIGFGDYHYKYASGREGDWFKVGFSARKKALTVYTMAIYHKEVEAMQRLGKHTTGEGCIYIKKLSDINLDVLKEIIELSIK
jgi:hypothetical protein